MQFIPETWKCEDGHDHNVIKVNFDLQDISRAGSIADKKIDHIDAHNPGGRLREAGVIRNRIIAGKLADAAVLTFLRQEANSHKLNWQFTEYDQARTDDFCNPDPYDLLMIDSQGQQTTIEIRSSFCYRLSPYNKIAKKLSIYGWYTTANKPTEEIKDWYWQVVYYLRPLDITPPDRETWPDVKVFEDCLNSGCLSGFIVGGSSRKLLADISRATDRSDQDGAIYRSIYPICEGFDCQQMVNTMLCIHQKSDQ
jgi:hypothetical protein